MWREAIRERGESLSQRAKAWLYAEEHAFVALCYQRDTLSCCACKKGEGWALTHHHAMALPADDEDGNAMRNRMEKVQQMLGRWGMVEVPIILVVSLDGVDHAYRKAFPSMEKDALETAVKWDAAAAMGLAGDDAVVGYRMEDGLAHIAMINRHTLEQYRRSFTEAGLELRDVVYVEGVVEEDIVVRGTQLQYKSILCGVSTPIDRWSDGDRLAFMGAMDWISGTAISFFAKGSNPRVFRWNRLATVLCIVAAAIILLPLAVTHVQLQGMRAELHEVDARLALLAEEIEQRAEDESSEADIEQKQRSLLQLSKERVSYRGLLVRLGAIDVQGVSLDEVRFEAGGVSTLRGRATQYERLTEYMRALTAEGVTPRIEASLQQAEQRKDAQGVDFILSIELPREGVDDEK